jgi:hypothetical protein
MLVKFFGLLLVTLASFGDAVRGPSYTYSRNQQTGPNPTCMHIHTCNPPINVEHGRLIFSKVRFICSLTITVAGVDPSPAFPNRNRPGVSYIEED